MGERTFGKGSVQTLLPLGDGNTALRLTTARYYTPSGRSVQEGGITPDILVPQLSDPDYRSRNRVRESDLRRHLVNEAGVAGRSDPGRRPARSALRRDRRAADRSAASPTSSSIMRCRRSRGSAGPAAAAGRRRARPAPRQPLTADGGCATPLGLAKALALLVPAALLAGAYGFAISGRPRALRDVLVAALGPYRRRSPSRSSPCSPAGMPDRGRSFVWLAALGILASGAIGVYHAGVELDYCEGFTQCTVD